MASIRLFNSVSIIQFDYSIQFQLFNSIIQFSFDFDLKVTCTRNREGIWFAPGHRWTVTLSVSASPAPLLVLFYCQLHYPARHATLAAAGDAFNTLRGGSSHCQGYQPYPLRRSVWGVELF